MSRLFESSLTAKISNMLVEEENLKEGYCPRCGIAMQGYPATSRFDNKTEICSDCGTDEAMKNFTGETLEDPNKYDTKTGKELINAVEPNRNDIAGDSEENLKDIKEAALPKEPPVRGKNERVADFIIDYDVYEFRNVYDGDNDEERRTKLIQDIEKDPAPAKKYVQDIANDDDRPEWRDQAEQILKLFEGATNKKEIEDRIGELRAKIDDDASEDEKKAMEKEIAELEDKLNESNAGTESITEIKLHLEDIKKILDDEGSIDAGLLKSKIEELLKLIDEHKQIMNESVSLGDDLLQNAIDSLNDLIMYADDGSLNRDDPDYSDFFKALDKAQETVDALNDAFNKKEESTLTEDSYDEDIFQTIENALYDAGLDVTRYTDAGMLTKNLGWCVSNSEGEVQLTCAGTYLDESSKLTESDLADYNKLKQEVDTVVHNVFDGTDFTVSNVDINDGKLLFTVTAFGPSDNEDGSEEMTREVELDVPELNYLDAVSEACQDWMSAHSTPDAFYESALNESKVGSQEMKYDLIDAVKNCLKRYKSSFKGYDLKQMREIIKSALDYTNNYFEREDFMYYINEGAELKESYSERLGGDPSDFISDLEELKAKLYEIDTDKFGSKLAAQMVDDFISTCDSQIGMTESRYHLNPNDDKFEEPVNESVNVVTSDGSTVDTNDGASVTSNDGNVTVVTTDGTTVSINSTPEEPIMDVPVEEPVEEIPDEEIPADAEGVGDIPVEEVPEEPTEEEPIEEDAPVEEPELEDEEETDNIEAKKLDMIKNQGNVYMLKITENDGKETYWVCEDYNQETNEGNNASQFDNKEDADDNYFHRVGLNVGDAAGDAE